MATRRSLWIGLAACLGLAVCTGWVLCLATPTQASPAVFGWNLAPAETPFAFARFDAEFSLVTSKVYFLGGRLPTGATDGTIWRFDPVTGAYQDTLRDMPVPVSNHEIARLVNASDQEALITFGGRLANGAVTNTVQVYYPASNSTAILASDPYPGTTLPGGVAVVDNLAYVFGGFHPSGYTTANTYIFDLAAAAGSRWTAGPPLTLARGYIATAVVDRVIYAMGGDVWIASSAALSATARTEKLNTATALAWDDDDVAEMPVACGDNRAFGFSTHSSHELAGQVVVAGCGQWSDEIVESMSYSVANDTWDTAFPDLNFARRNFAAAFVPTGAGGGGQPGLWVWGGIHDFDTTEVRSAEYYDVARVPIADFVSSSPVSFGTPVVFTSTASGLALNYHWDCGDGATHAEPNPTHLYAAPGTYTVTLTVTNPAGSDSVSHPVSVTGQQVFLPFLQR